MGKAHDKGQDVTAVRSPHRTRLPDTVGSAPQKPPSLQGRANTAQTTKQHRFRDLYRCLNAALFLDCWHDLNKQAASGVENVTAEAYAVNVQANIEAWVHRLKAKRSRANLVRRWYIPKENGKERPLGIPTLEDKRVQRACAKLLTAIYEQDFLEGRDGYRAGRGALDAVSDLTFALQYGRYGYLVEADVQGFCAHVDHTGLVDMLRVRSDDRAVLPVIQQGLQAGILDRDGQGIPPETGTPQGGTVSPPTKLQTFFFGIGFSRIRIDPKHNIHLMSGDFDPLHKGTNEVPLACPVSPLYPMLHCGGKVFQAANNELQFCLHSRLVRELLALFLQTGEALAYTRHSGRKFQLVDEPIRITVDSACQALPHLGNLFFDCR